MYLMPFDCETGGLNPNGHTLLTAYMAILDENLNKLDELDLKLKPDDGKYVCDQEALDVNKIILEEHDKIAITYSQAIPLIETFLKKHSPKKRGIRPAGHNIAFDIAFLKGQLKIDKIWEDKCHYRVLDTTPIATFMQDLGVWPDKLGSLTSLVEYFKIPMMNAHTAKDDVLMWIEVYKQMKVQTKQAMTGSNNGDELSLLEI